MGDTTHTIITTPKGKLGLHCNIAGKTSWHPDDVREGYCITCHEYIESLRMPEEEEELWVN